MTTVYRDASELAVTNAASDKVRLQVCDQHSNMGKLIMSHEGILIMKVLWAVRVGGNASGSKAGEEKAIPGSCCVLVTRNYAENIKSCENYARVG